MHCNSVIPIYSEKYTSETCSVTFQLLGGSVSAGGVLRAFSPFQQTAMERFLSTSSTVPGEVTLCWDSFDSFLRRIYLMCKLWKTEFCLSFILFCLAFFYLNHLSFNYISQLNTKSINNEILLLNSETISVKQYWKSLLSIFFMRRGRGRRPNKTCIAFKKYNYILCGFQGVFWHFYLLFFKD